MIEKDNKKIKTQLCLGREKKRVKKETSYRLEPAGKKKQNLLMPPPP
jgi:hypothetical protein